MNLAMIWFWDRASEIMPYWRDGLRAAIEYIEKYHHVAWYLDKQVPPEDYYDAILFWGDSECPFFQELSKYSCKKGLCLSTMPTNFENLRKLDAVFCESQPVYEAVRAQGIRAIKAFGTDVAYFTPPPDTFKKDIEYFYPATFSPWKKQSDIAHLGDQLLCVGTVQPDGQGELEACRKAGVRIEIGYFPAEKIREYYQRSKRVLIPAIHGSERTCIESLSCGIIPEVNPENIKTHSYIDEFNKSGYLFPRDFVVKNYSHIVYAKKILQGLQ